MNWSFFKLDTGEILGRVFSGTERNAILNTPQGCGRLRGAFDHLSARVDVVALAASGSAEPEPFVIDYQPPQPGPEYEWHAATRRWRVRLDVATARARDARAREQIDRLESRQHRIIRERLIATLPDGAVKTALVDIDTQIAALRSHLI